MMIQITHEEARRLIDRKADYGLDPELEKHLGVHLTVCADCRSHSETMHETESVLRQTLRKEWNDRPRPLPLSMDVIYRRVKVGGRQPAFLTTRTALIGAVVVLFTFIAWQSVGTPNAQLQSAGTVPLIPTPATYTITNTLPIDCPTRRYVVKAGDTLAGIAQQFAVDTASILLANSLTIEPSTLPRELLIPLCEMTPTSTIHPPISTTTPGTETLTTTPG